MRILFTFMGGTGHFIPLISVARAAEDKGHTVTFGCGPSMRATVEAAGFTVFPFGSGTAKPPERRPLRPLDAAREDQEFRDNFARSGAHQRIPYSMALCREWQPDILVCDETDFGSMIAAECLEIPYAVVLVMAAGSFVRADVVGEVLNELRAAHGLAPDSALNMLWHYLALSPFPPTFRDPAYPLPSTGHSFCPVVPQTDNNAALPWLLSLPERPTVYFTLGTVFNMESGDLFTRVLTGLRDLPINVIVTIGSYLNPAELGPQPDHVYIERFIDQDLILPHCQLVVSHGGSGSVSGTLLHGRPSVLIPLGADQPLNAARCQQLGLAEVLDPITVTPPSVQTAVANVLANSSYREVAERLRDEFVALPGPMYVIELLEQLAAAKRPVII